MVFLVLAYAAWNRKPWAWTLGVALTAGSMLLEVVGLLTEGQPIAGTLVSMAANSG